jgi:hypothetical protein
MTESMRRRPAVGGDEVDAFSRHRHAHRWRSGEVAGIKRRARRRERHSARQALRSGRY